MQVSYKVSGAPRILSLGLLLLIGFAHPGWGQEKDPFLVSTYNQLHQSPKQDIFHALHPMPAGVVYIQHPGEGEKEMREHFRTMKELGFNSLKQIMVAEGWTLEEVQLIALEEGIIPWWYGDGGWEPITPNLLKKLKMDAKLSMAEIRAHPEMQKYQTEVLRQRILRTKAYKAKHGQGPKGAHTAFDPTIGGRGLELNQQGEALFKSWVQSYYGTVDQLNHAWRLRHAGLGSSFSSWVDFE